MRRARSPPTTRRPDRPNRPVALRNTNLEFYRARADEARAAGEEATLDHVRERCRRSEVAWSALADKAQRGEQLRIEDQKRKAATATSISNEDHIQDELSESDFRAR